MERLESWRKSGWPHSLTKGEAEKDLSGFMYQKRMMEELTESRKRQKTTHRGRGIEIPDDFTESEDEQD